MKIKYYFRTWVLIFFMTLLGTGCSQPLNGRIHHLSALEVNRLIQENNGDANFVILDVRTSKEFDQGHIDGAVMLDYYSPNFNKRLQQLTKSKTYVIYCTTGYRSGRTIKTIEKMGFNTIYHLQHGVVEWYGRKLPLVRS